MQRLRHVCAAVWDRLNPSEPGPRFLALFFAAAMALFVIAYLIGRS